MQRCMHVCLYVHTYTWLELGYRTLITHIISSLRNLSSLLTPVGTPHPSPHSSPQCFCSPGSGRSGQAQVAPALDAWTSDRGELRSVRAGAPIWTPNSSQATAISRSVFVPFIRNGQTKFIIKIFCAKLTTPSPREFWLYTMLQIALNYFVHYPLRNEWNDLEHLVRQLIYLLWRMRWDEIVFSCQTSNSFYRCWPFIAVAVTVVTCYCTFLRSCC